MGVMRCVCPLRTTLTALIADEPRRSGRATKGQHKNASSSPAPAPKPVAKTTKPKPKPANKTAEPEPEDDEDDDEGEIRCICNNNNGNDKRAFIGCDACTVWQHNVCMGINDDEDDIPEHYFCEECRPEEHQETLQALAKGEPIWEMRNKIWQNEKKSKNRKNKGKNDQAPPGWLKKDVPAEVEEPEEQPEEPPAPAEPVPQEKGNKRKREEVKEEPKQSLRTNRSVRRDRKSAASHRHRRATTSKNPNK